MQERIVGTGEAGQRLNKYLQRVLPEAGSGFLYKMLRKKNITLNGKKAEGNEMIRTGDKVTFFLSDETFGKFAGKTVSTTVTFAGRATKADDIVYEDEHVIVAYKPAGLLSQKDTPESESINEQLLQYLSDSGKITADSLKQFKPSICNRLDRNTAGIVLFAKTLSAGQAVHRCLKERSIDKFYFAYVLGEMTEDLENRAYLTKDALTNKVTISKTPIDQNSTEIHTKFYPVAYNGEVTLVKILLLTGKSHQIRGVLQSLGHPILGDPKYMTDSAQNTSVETDSNNKLTMRYRRKYHMQGQQLVAYAYRFPTEVPEALAGLRGKTLRSALPRTFAEILTGEVWNREGDPYGILEI